MIFNIHLYFLGFHQKWSLGLIHNSTTASELYPDLQRVVRQWRIKRCAARERKTRRLGPRVAGSQYHLLYCVVVYALDLVLCFKMMRLRVIFFIAHSFSLTMFYND